MIIRICTEDKGNSFELKALCSKYFDGYTIYSADGVWKGTQELSLIIEIAVLDRTTRKARTRARELAIAIKVLNKQEAVLIEYIDSKNELV